MNHIITLMTAFILSAIVTVSACADLPSVVVEEFLARTPSLTRVGRSLTVEAFLSNRSETSVQFEAVLRLPKGVTAAGQTKLIRTVTIESDKDILIDWTITAVEPVYEELVLELRHGSTLLGVRRLPVRFLEPLPEPLAGQLPDGRIPEPVIPKKTSDILVGAHHCPIWRAEDYLHWQQLKKHPERTPALGFYAQEHPDIADWETKWAVEHGVDFFIYCWYRSEQNGPVKTRFETAITDSLFKSRFQNNIRFTIMWENQARGTSGVENEADLINNLFPYWLNTFFKRENYLKIDNKPVLYIYRPSNLIDDLGSKENVRLAMTRLREAAKEAGFDGLWLLGEYRGAQQADLQLMKELGLDYTFAYCWHLSNSPAPDEAIQQQMNAIRNIDRQEIIPQVVTVSQAWSGWRDEGSIWKLPPLEFELLLRKAKQYIENNRVQNSNSLSGRMLILDNWNEWGEGHYLAPYTEYGFGYLDAIARVFTETVQPVDLIPSDVGLGNYDRPYREWLTEQRKATEVVTSWVFKPTEQKDQTEQKTLTTTINQWRPMMNTGKFEFTPNGLTVTSTTSDPAIRCPLARGFRAAKYNVIRVRMAVEGLNGRGANVELYWNNNPSDDWHQKRGVTLPLIDNGQVNDYLFPVAENSNWSDVISGLRLDFATVPNVTVRIEQISAEKAK